ncbi:hypothetical protein CSUI_003002 [Cystoisospora suis]|uniref:Uncharacterized protein n=1 Tax=Cystoisospora suis TaxID=483139 RepID=A0A2C6L4B8_9APIC|nr:hypothetical protein CSUI_003002 [Cystoisospora suis]
MFLSLGFERSFFFLFASSIDAEKSSHARLFLSGRSLFFFFFGRSVSTYMPEKKKEREGRKERERERESLDLSFP